MSSSNKVIINKKYSPLIAYDNRYNIITGGRGSGKSFSVTVILCLLTYQANEKILFTRKTLVSAHLSIIPEFTAKIELLGLSDDFDVTAKVITNKRTGSQIIFAGLQSSSKSNTANLKSLEGISVWVLDEAEELINEDEFDRIDLSIRKEGAVNRVVLILNPTTKEHFIYGRFFERRGVEGGSNLVKGDVTYIHTTYLDNLKNLSKSFLDRIEYMRLNEPEKYKHQILGGWLEKAEGVVYTNWEVGKFKDNGNTIFGQDYGFSIDFTTLTEVSIFKESKEIYLKQLLYKTGLSTDEIYIENKRYAGDSLIIADSAEPRLIEELSNKGNNIEPAEKGKGSVLAGIGLMQGYKLIIDPDSLDLIKELNNYQWSDKKKSTPVDKWNDILDGVRYAVIKHLEHEQEAFFF